jgi:hypothetical protein
MNITTYALSDIEPTDTGWKLSSCEKYWVVLGVLDHTPGFLFLWTGEHWSDGLSDALLYDREAALTAAEPLYAAGIGYGIVRAVNLADYLRADRQMAGYPRHQAGKLRHSGSDEALQQIYQAVTGGSS